MNAYTASLRANQPQGALPYKPGTVAAMNQPGSVVSKLADFVKVSDVDGTQAGRRRAAISLAFTLSDRRHALAEILKSYDETQAELEQLQDAWDKVDWNCASDVIKLEDSGGSADGHKADLLVRLVNLLREV